MVAANYNQRSDRDLVLACQRREPQAFEELVKRHQRSVYTLLFQLAPDWPDLLDLSQEVFIRVWRTINNLRNPMLLRSWLTKQVINLFFEEWQTRPQPNNAKTLACQNEADGSAGSEWQEPYIEDEIVLNDNSTSIGEALKRLPEVLRTPIVLRELEGLNYEEIALLTKTEIGTVQSRIAKARAKLQNILRGQLNGHVESFKATSR